MLALFPLGVVAGGVVTSLLGPGPGPKVISPCGPTVAFEFSGGLGAGVVGAVAVHPAFLPLIIPISIAPL